MTKYILTNIDWKEEQKKKLQELAVGYEVYDDATDTEKLMNTEVVIHWDRKMGEFWEAGKLPNLKWVQAISAGVNYLPLADFKEKGIILTNASGIHQHTISEFVIGALLFHMRGFKTAQHNQQQKVWEQDADVMELNGKTMMVFGVGNIGRRLATIAKAFGMKVIGVNRSGKEVAEVDQVVTQEHCDDIIKEADIIVNILPETEETIQFFDEERLSQVKRGVLFVNVGRGTSVNETALLSALDDGTIAYAALDVFSQEPLETDSRLWEHPNVFVSPHVSGSVEHFRDALFEVLEPNAAAYVAKGQPSMNVIDYEKSY